MKTKTKKFIETDRNLKVDHPVRLYNPHGMDHHVKHCIKSIEATDEYTRIDFVFRSSMIYDNGGWIQMDENAYIQPVGSATKYRLIKAIGIPITPLKHYFKRKGEYHTYTLIFPGLPKNTKKIDIIEKLAPGTYFNFFNIDYSKWITIPHVLDLPRNNN